MHEAHIIAELRAVAERHPDVAEAVESAARLIVEQREVIRDWERRMSDDLR